MYLIITKKNWNNVTFSPSQRNNKLAERRVMSNTRTEMVIQGLFAGRRLTGLKI